MRPLSRLLIQREKKQSRPADNFLMLTQTVVDAVPRIFEKQKWLSPGFKRASEWTYSSMCGLLLVLKAICQVKERGHDKDTTVTAIYSEELGNLHNRCYNFVTKMPQEQVTKRSLYRHTATSHGNQRERESPEKIVVNKDLRWQMEDIFY